MSQILTREEFVALVDEYGRTVLLQDVEGEGRRVAETYDAALARIAELDRQLESVRKMLGNACEILGGEQAAVDGRLAYRARIAREFLGELTFRYTDIDLDKSAFHCFIAVLDEWEAAAKEGE